MKGPDIYVPCYTKEHITLTGQGVERREIRMGEIAMKVGGTNHPNCVTIEIDGRSRFVDAFALIDAIDQAVKCNQARRVY